MAKKGINGRAKGAKFELETAKGISAWWGTKFHRTPGSGGLHWKSDNRVTGDITPGSDAVEDFPFSVECKKVEDWNFEQIIKGVGEVRDWWSQCHADALTVDKVPLLIFTKNRSPSYYMMPYRSWTDVGLPVRRVFITSVLRDNAKKEDLVAIGHFEDLTAVSKETIVDKLKNGKGSVKNGRKKSS